jgi:hypothetical protein
MRMGRRFSGRVCATLAQTSNLSHGTTNLWRARRTVESRHGICCTVQQIHAGAGPAEAKKKRQSVCGWHCWGGIVGVIAWLGQLRRNAIISTLILFIRLPRFLP